jgi:glucose-6-phosphate isomerase
VNHALIIRGRRRFPVITTARTPPHVEAPIVERDPAFTGSAARILAGDPTVFAEQDDPAYASVSTRLGWVDAPQSMRGRVDDLEAFAASAAAEGLDEVYLLGMGGSSLCAEVLRDVPLRRRGAGARLTVLDTTDERAIVAATGALVPARSLFIVASKSGSTIEVSSLERHFWGVMTAARGGSAPRHFVAITDEGTNLAHRAAEAGYREVFINPEDIGGRFSALSLFGLVPAALLGIDLDALLSSASRMAAESGSDSADNPGLALGRFVGTHAKSGRDKLTLLLPATLAPLGAWIEQLVAESTGKRGKGALPVVGEPLGPPSEYGEDRVFVAVETPGDTTVRRAADALAGDGRPVFRILTRPDELGGEFFRWEIATAVAGLVLSVNPFDEPNVRDAKERTRKQLDTFRTTGSFRLDPPLRPHDGYARRESHPPPRGPADASRGRYVALLDYLPMDAAREELIARLRRTIRRRTGLATTHGVGPRYLHSTGQYHKGGPNSGVFLLLTATDATTTPVPGEAYSFRTLKQAQALGDFDALVDAGRDVVHYHLEGPVSEFWAELEQALLMRL